MAKVFTRNKLTIILFIVSVHLLSIGFTWEVAKDELP